MKRFIRDLLGDIKLRIMAIKAKSQNYNPYTFKVWEHRGWGDRISINRVNKDGTFDIDGHLPRKPVVGDFIIYNTQAGNQGKGVVYSVKYPGDPPDMFFAVVVPMCVYHEETRITNNPPK